MIAVVSGYVPLRSNPRSQEQYLALGQKLLGIDHRVIVFQQSVEECWLYNLLNAEKALNGTKYTHSTADNPNKNSLEYHIVQAEKTQWLEYALAAAPDADTFVWIDYGIFHVPGVTKEAIDSFLDRAEYEKMITIPGCWQKNAYTYDDSHPCWRFCGGVMVVPRGYVEAFNWAMKGEYTRWLRATGNISWEVNTLARLEQRDTGLPIWWYPADHNASLFTNYQATGAYAKVH